MKKIFLLITIFSIGLIFSCKDKDAERQNMSVKNKFKRKYEKPQNFSFTLLDLKQDSIKKSFKDKYTGTDLQIIYSLNRRDAETIFKADSIIIPDKFDDDFLAYSPFPYTIKELEAVDKIAIFSYPIQAYALYENGELIKWGPTSMGSKKHKTPNGLYFANWKGEEIKSTFDDEWILKWNFNIQNEEGIGWHQYTLPGYPASHSCLRLLEADAKFMYDWADQWVLEDKETVKAKGTPTIVYGDYNFEGKAPWLQLAHNPKANDVNVQELQTLIKKYLNEILKEQENSKLVAQQTNS